MTKDKATYMRLCGIPTAGTLVGLAGTAQYVKKNGKWVKV
jgi:hypothetical protein